MRLQGIGKFIINFIVNFYFTAVLFQKSVCDETSGTFVQHLFTICFSRKQVKTSRMHFVI